MDGVPELVIALKDNVKLTPLDAVKDQAREFMVSGTVYDEENRFGFVPVDERVREPAGGERRAGPSRWARA